MTEVKLGTITDERLARLITSAMDLYPLTWGFEVRDGKAVLEVFADVKEEAEVRLLEGMRQ